MKKKVLNSKRRKWLARKARTQTSLERSDRVVLTVADNGIGLPQDRARLFEPYVTNREKGTGLGLSIVKKIVEEHSGLIRHGDSDLGGVRFSIQFPVRSTA